MSETEIRFKTWNFRTLLKGLEAALGQEGVSLDSTVLIGQHDENSTNPMDGFFGEIYEIRVAEICNQNVVILGLSPRGLIDRNKAIELNQLKKIIE